MKFGTKFVQKWKKMNIAIEFHIGFLSFNIHESHEKKDNIYNTY